ncbi:MAG: hypothetical protein M3R15_20735 [Acidobacteriota bacterium]|nr:hypothetical protein [Acidobacteriota bacterium]
MTKYFNVIMVAAAVINAGVVGGFLLVVVGLHGTVQMYAQRNSKQAPEKS